MFVSSVTRHSSGLQHVWQTLLYARISNNLICGARKSFLIYSSLNKSVLRYFLLSSGKTVTTIASLDSSF